MKPIGQLVSGDNYPLGSCYIKIDISVRNIFSESLLSQRFALRTLELWIKDILYES